MQSRTDPNGLCLRTTQSALIHESLLYTTTDPGSWCESNPTATMISSILSK